MKQRIIRCASPRRSNNCLFAFPSQDNNFLMIIAITELACNLRINLTSALGKARKPTYINIYNTYVIILLFIIVAATQ